jgi:hypothetical protein
MSLDKMDTITDVIEAMKSMHEEMAGVKAELSSCKSEVSRLNRNNTHLLADNRRYKAENKSLKAEVERLRAEIEKYGGKQVEKDSTNSSVPPTKQSIAAQAALRTRSLREPSGRKSGGQPGHAGHELAKTDSPAITEHHKVRTCPHCGAVIPEDAEQVCTKTTQVIDIAGILVDPEVAEHRRYTAVCPHCHRKAHAKLPSGNSKKTSYGPKLQALVIYLSVVQSIPLDRIVETMRDVFCVRSFSEGTVKNILERNARKALPAYQCLLEYISKEEAAGMDETGVYINKLLCWFWCLQCRKYCYVFADRSRGMKALEDHGILPYLVRLVLYTDRHSTYFNLEVRDHQVCLAHLLRNLQYLNDLNPEQQWAGKVQELLREAQHLSNTSTNGPPGTEVRKSYEKRLDELLDQDLSQYGKEFQTLQNGLILCKKYIFTFLDHYGVPHHNNSSEGAIRILKVKTKVSGGFRTQAGADEYACFHSLVETAKRNGVSKFDTLYQLMIEDNPDKDFIERITS